MLLVERVALSLLEKRKQNPSEEGREKIRIWNIYYLPQLFRKLEAINRGANRNQEIEKTCDSFYNSGANIQRIATMVPNVSLRC